VNTEVIAAQGMIITAGGIDCHVHFICPQLVNEAIASGKVSWSLLLLPRKTLRVLKAVKKLICS
jgi:hypothetical protein